MRNILVRFTGNVLVCLLLMFAVASALAAEGGRASGQFESKGILLKITDAYAFRGRDLPDRLEVINTPE